MQDIFRIIAIRPVTPPDTLSHEEKEKVQHIHKCLYGYNQWLYFYDDVEIDVEDTQSSNEILLQDKDSHTHRIYDINNVHIDICAIVGKNGTGKSSIIDLLIRTINNLSAALIGEKFRFPAAEHLHFIEHVYADLCVELNSTFFIYRLRGRDITRTTFVRSKREPHCYEPYGSLYPILDSRSNPAVPIDADKAIADNILGNFFYTIICNYSMYGFNYRDYESERTPKERLKLIYDALSKEEKIDRGKFDEDDLESAVWLKGVFYKNDGYQAPIVVYPMRHDGIIKINAENELAKERLLKMFFYRNSNEEYPLRVINGNLTVKAIKLTPSSKDYGNHDFVYRKLKISRKQNLYNTYNKVGEQILKYWLRKYGLEKIRERGRNSLITAAYNYIIYKTIKIAYTYPQYSKLRSVIRAKEIVPERLQLHLDDMDNDRSFKTRKLFRTINFLRTDMYRHWNPYDINNLTERIESFIAILETPNKKRYNSLSFAEHIDSYLPPPIFEYDFLLRKGNGPDFDFNHLSSGEKQIAYTICSFLYHVNNIESAWRRRDSSLKYNHLNVIFDEVEQYYHPELQRCFISYLLDGLSCIEFQKIKGINIMIVTHSPFILSDIPRRNILILGDDANRQDIPDTFGGNINDMLSNPFFMDYSIGEIAKREIDKFIRIYKDMKEGELIPSGINDMLKHYDYIIKIIGDAYVKKTLERMQKEIREFMKTHS